MSQPVPAMAKATPARTAGALVLAGAVALLIGTFLPWIEVSGFATFSRNLISSSDGQILAVVASLAALIGVYLLLRGSGLVPRMVTLLAAAVAAWIVVVDYREYSQSAADITNAGSSGIFASAPIIATVGAGPYLSAIGAIVLAIGGLVAILRRNKPAVTSSLLATAHPEPSTTDPV